MDFPKQLNSNQRTELESEVSNEEIKRAVWECGTDKAPGLDGFTFGFFRHFWYLIDHDVYEAVRYFFIHNEIPIGCNSSFITLIPKIPDANLVKDFRPISLIGSLYKIIAKILTNRLVGSIIVNGSPTEELQFGRGLKQGDPLSTFLFIFIMESLHLSFQRVMDVGMFQDIKLGASVNLSHMFYADDAVFVGQWNDSNITTLVHVLECFYRVSGLKINMGKSKIMGVHVDNAKVSRAAVKLGCLILKARFLFRILIYLVCGRYEQIENME
ncbi:RNA-directed DNA polymerase, eukaryota [Tanacetum coccineum]